MSTMQLASDKDFPITTSWIAKLILKKIPWIIVYFLLGIRYGQIYISWYTLIFPLFLIFVVVFPILSKINFHFTLGPDTITIYQGVLSKQRKYIRYGVIQNILISQDFLDRIFGIATILIENASGGRDTALTTTRGGKRRDLEFIGALENKLSIPGLKKAKAEELKAILLQQMQQNPIYDSQSGL